MKFPGSASTPRDAMTSGIKTFALAAMALLSGCTTIYEGRYDFQDGWRKGEVVEVGTAETLALKRQGDCRKDGATYAPQAHYAVVKYRSNRRSASRVVPVPEGRVVKAGDLVYLKLKDCNAALPPRTAAGAEH